ncbi:MAG: hypothetical protein K2P92_07140 [Bdellovibrionaceae bacterium]|nr:hypothetical protein [Pseudobdellovibrionaceae bacterium]
MKQLQLISLVLTLIVSFNTQAQTSNHEVHHVAPVQSEKSQLASQVLTALRNQRENPRASQRFHSILTQEVNSEIQSEASSQKMTRDEYLENNASFRLFTARLRDMQFNSMTHNDILIALFKSAIRNEIQTAAENSLMSDETVSVFQQSALNKLGIVLPVDLD